MLGRLRMPLEECIKQFQKLTVQNLCQGRQLGLHIYSKNSQATEHLNKQLKELVKRRAKKPEEPAGSSTILADPHAKCKTLVQEIPDSDTNTNAVATSVVLAYNPEKHLPTVFRSYDHETASNHSKFKPRSLGESLDLGTCISENSLH